MVADALKLPTNLTIFYTTLNLNEISFTDIIFISKATTGISITFRVLPYFLFNGIRKNIFQLHHRVVFNLKQNSNSVKIK
jgi:spore maturation protein SpmB